MLKLTNMKDIKPEIISKITAFVDSNTVCFYDEDRQFYFFTISKWVDMVSNDKVLFKNYNDSNISNSIIYMKNPSFYISEFFGLNTTIIDSLIVVAGMFSCTTYDISFDIINSTIQCKDIEISKKAKFIIHDCIINSNQRLKLLNKHDLNKVVMDGNYDYVEFREDNHLDNVSIFENDTLGGVETLLITASKINNLNLELNKVCESVQLFACEIDNCKINTQNGDIRLSGCIMKDTNFDNCILGNFDECNFNKCEFSNCKKIKLNSDIVFDNCSFIGCKIEIYGNSGIYKNNDFENCIVETTYKAISDMRLENKKVKNKDVTDIKNIYYYTDATNKVIDEITKQSNIVLVLISNKVYSMDIKATKRNLSFICNLKKEFRNKGMFKLELYTDNNLSLVEMNNLFEDKSFYNLIGKSTISKTSKTFQDNMFGFLLLCDNGLYVLDSQNSKFVSTEIDDFRTPKDPLLKGINKRWDEYANVEKYHVDITMPLDKNFSPYMYVSEIRFETFNSNYEVLYFGDYSQSTIYLIFKHPSNSNTLTMTKMKISF